MAKKAIICQPTSVFTDEITKQNRERAISILSKKGYEIVNEVFEDYSLNFNEETKNIPLKVLAKSLNEMADCDAAYFCKGWRQTRKTMMEYNAAVFYELDIVYDEEEDL